MSNKTSSNLPDSARPSSGNLPFSHEQIVTQLDRITSSDVFTGAARQQRLLRHLVTKRLEGGVGELKEYTLGVEVFDRGDDFDPRLDPIVRVEASRLRSRLQKYYDGPGIEDPIRISLPRGAYVPSFAEPFSAEPSALATSGSAAVDAARPSGAVVETDEAVAVPAPRSRSRIVSALLLTASVILIAAAVWLAHRLLTPPPAPHYAKFRRITTDEVLCSSPSFSPDDRRLVYAQRDAGIWHLYERELATSAWTELTPGSSDDDYEPAWSPNGRSIAFRSDRDGGGLFQLSTRTKAVTRLTRFGYNPAWSPDSSRLAFSTATFRDPMETSADGSEIQVMDLTSKKIAGVALPTGTSALQPAWSPHGYRIAYWGTEANGDRDIWTVDANSSERATPVAVMHDAWTDWSPAWSADGRYLYFSSDRSGAMTLWRVAINERSGRVLGNFEPVPTPSSYTGWTTFAHAQNLFAYVRRIPFSELFKAPFDAEKGIDLAAKTQLTEGERGMHEPDMSPDGSSIVMRIQDPQEDLALIKPDGSDLHRLTDNLFEERYPRWSPDGSRIIFSSNRSHEFQLWSIHPDGGGLKQITTNGPVPFAWAPDGTLLGYTHAGLFNLDDPRRPVKDFGLPPAFRPYSWSPDRKAVVGRMYSSGFDENALFIFTPGSQDYWQIAPSAVAPSTVWMPQGEQLLFTRGDVFYLADAATHQVKQETSVARSDIHSRFTMSPDRKTLYFVESDDQQDIWTGSE